LYHLTSKIKTHQSAELIYHALCELIKNKNINSITIKELVEEAGVGRATFYRLFDSIEDVLHYKCDASFVDLRQYIIQFRKSEQLIGPTTSTDLLKPLLRFWYLDSFIIEIIIKINRLDILMSNVESMFSIMFSQLDHNSNSDFQEEYFVSMRSGILFNILVTWIKNKKDIPPDTLADILIKQSRAVENFELLF